MSLPPAVAQRPMPKDDSGDCVRLPLDAKLSQEDHLRIQDAADLGDVEATRKVAAAPVRATRLAAQAVHRMYVKPPRIADFAYMFPATEGLYAEVVRRPALVDDVQQRRRIVLAGPTTPAALLSSLRMGFPTLAIEHKQADEVWRAEG
jgi:DNA recombination protein RmuC